MGVSRCPSGYLLEVTCTSPLLLEVGREMLRILLRGWKIHTCLGTWYSCLVCCSLPESGVGKDVCAWWGRGYHLKAPFTCLNRDPLQWSQWKSTPLFLRKQSNLSCASVSPPSHRCPSDRGLVGMHSKALRLLLSHTPPGIVMKCSRWRWAWALSDLISLPTSPVLPPLPFEFCFSLS